MRKLVRESLQPLYESPYRITVNGKYYKVTGENTYPFEVVINKSNGKIIDVIISNVPSMYHGDDEYTDGFMCGDPGDKVNWNDTLPHYDVPWKKAYPGRLFLIPKVITFWSYPSSEELKQIIEIIEKKKDIKIYDNGWKIEVYKQGIENSGKKRYKNNYNRTFNSKIIPIERFISSKKPSEKERLQHTKSPLQKKNIVTKGFGSSHPDYIKKRKWQRAEMTSEKWQHIM